jgi:hypothetical protein
MSPSKSTTFFALPRSVVMKRQRSGASGLNLGGSHRCLSEPSAIAYAIHIRLPLESRAPLGAVRGRMRAHRRLGNRFFSESSTLPHGLVREQFLNSELAVIC